jgi:hypothetical protein
VGTDRLLFAWVFPVMCSSEMLMNYYQTVWCLAPGNDAGWLYSGSDDMTYCGI